MIVPVNYSVIAVNDVEKDGKLRVATAEKYMKRYFHKLVSWKVVREEREELHAALAEIISGPAEVIIIIGGIGTGLRNITFPVIKKYLDVEFPGFQEFTAYYLSRKIGLNAIFFRGLLGTIKTRFVYCIPDELKTTEIIMENIISRTAGIKSNN